MDTVNVIRASIFFIVGLILILYPKQVNNFQNFIMKLFRFNYEIKENKKENIYIVVLFFLIGIGLLVYSFY